MRAFAARSSRHLKRCGRFDQFGFEFELEFELLDELVEVLVLVDVLPFVIQ